jgi:hypothetical protein
VAEKWLDRGKDAEPALISPKMIELANAHAEEFKRRAEKAELQAQVAIEERNELRAQVEKLMEDQVFYRAEVGRKDDQIARLNDLQRELIEERDSARAELKGGGNE